MLLLASGITVSSCSSSKQTTSGSDTIEVTDTGTMGTGTRDTMGTRTGDTIRTDTTGTTPRP